MVWKPCHVVLVERPLVNKSTSALKLTSLTGNVHICRLNEGFASYLEYKGIANYHDDWDIESQFLPSDLHPVMDLDATINTHPIVQSVDHPDQITEIFDIISYSKGASVLR